MGYYKQMPGTEHLDMLKPKEKNASCNRENGFGKLYYTWKTDWIV